MSPHPIRSPLLQTVLDALSVRPMTLAEIASMTGETTTEARKAMGRLRGRNLVSGELIGRDHGRAIVRYTLTAPVATVREPTKQALIESLLSDEPQSEAEISRRAGVTQTSVRRILETLRAHGLAIATTLEVAPRPLRAWMRPPVCPLVGWITGELFRRAA